MRRALAKSSIPAKRPSSSPTVIARMADKLHFHGCTGCRRTYGCSCDTPEKNGTCRPCDGRELCVWDLAREPRDCCVGNTTQVTRTDQIELYDLAGPGPWFRCQTCTRHHARVITTP